MWPSQVVGTCANCWGLVAELRALEATGLGQEKEGEGSEGGCLQGQEAGPGAGVSGQAFATQGRRLQSHAWDAEAPAAHVSGGPMVRHSLSRDLVWLA